MLSKLNVKHFKFLCMMKVRILLSAVALFGMVLFAGAQTPYQSQATDPVPSGAKKSCYVDANNNGMCDLRESGQCTGNPVRQGLRQGPRNGQGLGRTGQGRGLGPCGAGRRR